MEIIIVRNCQDVPDIFISAFSMIATIMFILEVFTPLGKNKVFHFITFVMMLLVLIGYTILSCAYRSNFMWFILATWVLSIICCVFRGLFVDTFDN